MESIIVIYCCLTNYTKFSDLKQQTHIISVSLGQQFESSLTGWLCSGFHEVTVRMLTGLQSFEGLPGVRRSIFKLAELTQLSAEPVSVPCYKDLSSGRGTWLSLEQVIQR